MWVALQILERAIESWLERLKEQFLSWVQVQEEVRKFLFGPPDAKTPDGERYEIVEEEDVIRGERHTGFLFRFSMWATISFVAWVLAGGRAHIDCPEPFPNIHERDPVPKVIIRRQKKHPIWHMILHDSGLSFCSLLEYDFALSTRCVVRVAERLRNCCDWVKRGYSLNDCTSAGREIIHVCSIFLWMDLHQSIADQHQQPNSSLVSICSRKCSSRFFPATMCLPRNVLTMNLLNLIQYNYHLVVCSGHFHTIVVVLILPWWLILMRKPNSNDLLVYAFMKACPGVL